MKQRFLVRLASLLLVCAVAPLTGCEEDKDITSSLTYTVKLRVTGQNLAGLEAQVIYQSLRNPLTATPNATPSDTITFASRADTTFVVDSTDSFGFYDRVTATIALRKATCARATHPQASSFLRLEMLANDRVVLREELNAASAPRVTCSPYWTITTTADGDDWEE